MRHAVAAARGPDFPDDALRPLTPEGIDRWRRAVEGLREFGVSLDLILTSPFARAQETAGILAAGLKPKPRLVVVDALAAGARVAEVMAVIAKYAASPRGPTQIALVGHEPDLGDVATKLLGAKGSVTFKKGAVCRIDVDRAMPTGPGALRWLLPPSALRGLAP